MVGEAKLAEGEVEGLPDEEIQLVKIEGGGGMVADTMWTGKIGRICSGSYSCMLGTYIHSTNRPSLPSKISILGIKRRDRPGELARKEMYLIAC